MNLPRITIILLAMALTACAKKDGETNLRHIKKTGNGPDEFLIIPGKPLQAPESYANLPTPTPGGANLTDQTPKADSVAALGGNPEAVAAGAARSNEVALLNHTRRYGGTAGIRQTLAVEDQEIRRRHGRVNFFRIGPVDDYTTAYKKQWLDAYSEQERLRSRGVRTPTAPPPE